MAFSHLACVCPLARAFFGSERLLVLLHGKGVDGWNGMDGVDRDG